MQYTIGDVSKMVGLPAKTIRFYEESGVLSPITRGENGYRLYPQDVIEELKLLKYARDMGLPLGEIKKLMKGCDNGDCRHTGSYMVESVENYLQILTQKINQLSLLKSKLEQLRGSLNNSCRSNNKEEYCCDLLHQLVNYAKRKGGGINGR